MNKSFLEISKSFHVTSKYFAKENIIRLFLEISKTFHVASL